MKQVPDSLLAFQHMFPDDDACAAWLIEMRWPGGFRCPECGHDKGWALRSKAHTFERTFGANQLKQGRFFSCMRQPGNGFCHPPFPGCNRNREKMNGQNHPHRRTRQSAPAPQVRIRHTRQQAHRLRRPRPALGPQALLHPLPASRRARLEDCRGRQLHERRRGATTRRRDVDRDPAGRGCAS